jgi:transposase InsO family protein
MDGTHGSATAQDPRGLPALPQRHPPSAAHRIIRAVVTGEPGAGKLARRVREGDAGKGPKGTSPASYLAVALDIFSRYAVAWMVASRESAILAERMFAETIRKQRIAHGQLSIQADRGSAMASKPVAFLLADLGVTKSHSRPHVSNDNPYSESGF